MTHPKGKDLGGIRTLDGLMQRCHVDSTSGCWHCRLYLNQGRFPQVNIIHPETGQAVKMMGRRAALILAGKPPNPGHVAFARSNCEATDCVNPEHSRSASKKVWGKALAASDRMKGLPNKIAANRKTAASQRILTSDQVREIRVSDEPAAALGKRLGVSSYAVWSVRNGKTHKPASASSVFALAASMGVA
jgi:hypothetical protein